MTHLVKHLIQIYMLPIGKSVYDGNYNANNILCQS